MIIVLDVDRNKDVSNLCEQDVNNDGDVDVDDNLELSNLFSEDVVSLDLNLQCIFGKDDASCDTMTENVRSNGICVSKSLVEVFVS